MAVELSAIAEIGLVAVGHGHKPEELQAAARLYLEGQKLLSPVAAWGPWPMSEVHWAGADIGFCGKDHPQAQAITRVQVPLEEVADADQAAAVDAAIAASP